MIKQGRLGRLTRWLGWAILWGIFHPELYSKNFQMEPTEEFTGLVLWYFGLGLLLEYLYLKLVSIGVGDSEGLIPDTEAPDCPDHPWIPFGNQVPAEHSLLEFYCADGKSRNARTHGRVDGRLVFEVHYETSIAKKQRKHPLNYCPTHWRHHRSEAIPKEREVDDVF